MRRERGTERAREAREGERVNGYGGMSDEGHELQTFNICMSCASLATSNPTPSRTH